MNPKKRKLRAILFADIVGYTALMQKDETTARTLLQKFRNTLNEKVAQHSGEIINNYGDGCLCTFESAVDAMTCAKEVQLLFQEAPKVPVRIGLHSGDVFFEDNNVFGDSVNIASRIESLGVAGAVLFSKQIKRHIANQTEFKVQSLGEFHFKNVEKEMKVFALTNEGLAIPKKEEIKGKLKEPISKKSNLPKILAAFGLCLLLGLGAWYLSTIKKEANSIVLDNDKIAIFPFEVKGSSDIQYLGEGMVDLLATKLDGIPHIKPIDPNLIFNELDTEKRVSTDVGTEVTQNFQAGKFVLGSIIELNDKIEITASKYDQNGTRLDKKSVAGLKTDLASLVDELTRTLIASEYAEANGEFTNLALSMSNNIPALKAYLEGEQALRAGNIPGAINYFEQATTQDSTFALAWYQLRAATAWTLTQNFAGIDEAIEKYKHKLPKKLQELRLAAIYQEKTKSKEKLYLDILDKYGESAEITSALAEYIYHSFPQFGKSHLLAKEWFLKAKAANPNNQEPYYHLMEIAIQEEDLAATKSMFEATDSSSALWPGLKKNMLYFQDIVTEEEIKVVAHHPAYNEYISFIIFFAPENPTKYYNLLTRILAERGEHKYLTMLRRQMTIFGKEQAAFDYSKQLLNMGYVPSVRTPAHHLTLPALFIGQHNYRPFDNQYENLMNQVKERTEPWALYAKCKYALTLNQPKVYAQTKKQLWAQTKVERTKNYSSHFFYSLNALEAQQNKNFKQALIWIDSTAQYSIGSEYLADKVILKAQIFEEQRAFKQSIALYENIEVGSVYHLMKGFATYNLGRLYEKDGQYDKAIAKSELLIDLYRDCDEKYKPWVAEAVERRDRLQAKKL